MRNTFVKSMLFSLVCSTLIPYSVSAASDSLQLKLQIGSKTVVINDSQSVQLLQSPFSKGNSTYVPIRFISERLMAEVKWDQTKQEVTIKKDDKTIVLTVNKKIVKINGSVHTLESPALVVDGTTFVPLRFVSENLNASLIWEQQTQSITIQTRTEARTNSNTVTPSSKTDEEQIKQLLQKQIDYLNSKDAAGALSITHKPTETRDELQANFDTYDMEYSIDSVSDISVKGSEASALVTRIVKRYAVDFNKVEPEKYVEMHMKLVLDTTFVKVNGEWKVYRVSNKGMTNLLQK